MLQRHEIAERQNIPVEFLEQITACVKTAPACWPDVEESGSGYSLIKSPRKIPSSQVILILVDPSPPISCVSKTAYQKCADCPYAAKPSCPLQQAMRVRCGMPMETFSTLHIESIRPFEIGGRSPRPAMTRQTRTIFGLALERLVGMHSFRPTGAGRRKPVISSGRPTACRKKPTNDTSSRLSTTLETKNRAGRACAQLLWSLGRSG